MVYFRLIVMFLLYDANDMNGAILYKIFSNIKNKRYLYIYKHFDIDIT